MIGKSIKTIYTELPADLVSKSIDPFQAINKEGKKSIQSSSLMKKRSIMSSMSCTKG